MAARAMGKMIAITLANNMPGHLNEPGKLSEIHALTSVAKIVMMLIYSNVSVALCQVLRNQQEDLHQGE